MLIHLLHGFLGLPSDWNQFRFPYPVLAHYLYDYGMPSEKCSLEIWAKQFCNSIEKLSADSHVLLGYSLGARLAMHAMLYRRHLWKRVILISGNPGLSDQKKKEERLSQDTLWAKRFQNEPWDPLMTAWNAQALFGGHQLLRAEEQFSRNILSNTIQYWSLSKQQNLLPQIGKIKIPINWISGEKDPSQLENISDYPNIKLWIAPNVAHRVPWEDPKQFEMHIQNILS